MNASYGQLPPIAEGELVDIHLRRARVLTVSEDRRYIQVEAPNAYRLVLDRAKVAIDQVAPSVEDDKRKVILVGLRALLDRLESDPSLPTPANVHAAAYVGYDEIFDLAKLIGATASQSDDGPRSADVEFTAYSGYATGAVRYYLYAKPPAGAAIAEAVGAQLDEPDVDTWEHEGGRPLVDDGDLINNCSAWMVEGGVGHTHTCALLVSPAPVIGSEHDGNHICGRDGCGREWYFDGDTTTPPAEAPTLPADLGQHDETDVSDRGIL